MWSLYEIDKTPDGEKHRVLKPLMFSNGKSLQNQYKRDYEGNKYLLDKDNQKLKISVITGRKNHKCKFFEENEILVPKEKREINSNLNDIFEFDAKEIEKRKEKDKSADVWDLPCKIEIKEKNWKKIREYLKQNKTINPNNFQDIKSVTRGSIASICPYWSPVLPEKFELKNFPESKKRSYTGLNNTRFIIHQAKPGCKFYEQFNSYIDSDIM